ncbi:MAG: hypothetical protein GFH27_549321n147 [Chloroflexi bacterium AL-W]|nr:hypothetical protein [Chloroflexi bacterium AL-N1]NOK65024.1 hypothetical protein [Chloroflexi bacterium AL-N10]NOK76794.1 hypothetical protein [Chloroflexi bacterium AL-N5]NOK84686.1 hypothetical protein [Chloroflexi bacterium AL-W]NOK86489.1 hypothetical protein [Chloroflexi bacterium AL-N15]
MVVQVPQKVPQKYHNNEIMLTYHLILACVGRDTLSVV